MGDGNFKIAIAPDSFKGTLSAVEAAECIERGLKKVLSGISVRKIPMADGGEGTVSAVVRATGGRTVKRTVRDPLGRRVKAAFGITGDGKTAVIEMAAASGMGLLKPRDLNPMKTSTYGTGELMREALEMGVERMLVGIGGSATNDGGTGMAAALGARFLGAGGRRLDPCGRALGSLKAIDISGLDPRIGDVRIEVACDVDNPLTGPRGAARVYSPQKGATPAMVKRLDANLRVLARVIKKDLGIDIEKVPGAGAAGGLGAGLMAFAGGDLRPGVDIVMDIVRLKQRIRGCDLVITGEGRTDAQTVYGKTPAGVAKTAAAAGVPVIAFSGSLGSGAEKVHDIGIGALFSALRENVDEEDLRRRAPGMLVSCAEETGRVLAMRFGRKSRLHLRAGRGAPKGGERR
ncbi:MAG: glycerate kinase [Kiritimatiellia bacterium]